ncbi:unnamed protein product, partial [Polarella glacialis]
TMAAVASAELVQEFQEVSEARSPLAEEDLALLLARVKRTQLATDQVELVSQALEGHTLTCSQAGLLLQAIKLGLLQRILVFQVFRGRLSDAASGLDL